MVIYFKRPVKPILSWWLYVGYIHSVGLVSSFVLTGPLHQVFLIHAPETHWNTLYLCEIYWVRLISDLNLCNQVFWFIPQWYAGCFFSTAVGGLRCYENPKNKITAVPATEEEIWGAKFMVRKITTTIYIFFIVVFISSFMISVWSEIENRII